MFVSTVFISYDFWHTSVVCELVAGFAVHKCNPPPQKKNKQQKREKSWAATDSVMVVSNIKKKSLLADAEVYNHAAQHMLSVKKLKIFVLREVKVGSVRAS